MAKVNAEMLLLYINVFIIYVFISCTVNAEMLLLYINVFIIYVFISCTMAK
jgi:hypothetical protein